MTRVVVVVVVVPVAVEMVLLLLWLVVLALVGKLSAGLVGETGIPLAAIWVLLVTVVFVDGLG